MVYTPFVRMTLLGGLGPVGATPVETWMCSLALGQVTPTELSDITPATRAEILDETVAWVERLTSRLSQAASLISVKFASIGFDGKTPTDPDTGAFEQVVLPAPASTEGGGGANTMPFQSSIVLSMGTLRAGPRGRGRIYSPVPTVVVGNDGLMTVTAQGEVLTSFRDWLSAINLALAGQPSAVRVIVASSFGDNSQVIRVRCGRVVDTQQRRRGELPEQYASQLLV